MQFNNVRAGHTPPYSPPQRAVQSKSGKIIEDLKHINDRLRAIKTMHYKTQQDMGLSTEQLNQTIIHQNQELIMALQKQQQQTTTTLIELSDRKSVV